MFGGWEEGSLEGKDGDWVRGEGGDDGVDYKHIRFYGGFGYLECLFAERIVEQGRYMGPILIL